MKESYTFADIFEKVKSVLTPRLEKFKKLDASIKQMVIPFLNVGEDTTLEMKMVDSLSKLFDEIVGSNSGKTLKFMLVNSYGLVGRPPSIKGSIEFVESSGKALNRGKGSSIAICLNGKAIEIPELQMRHDLSDFQAHIENVAMFLKRKRYTSLFFSKEPEGEKFLQIDWKSIYPPALCRK